MSRRGFGKAACGSIAYLAAAVTVLLAAGGARAAAPGPGWAIDAVAMPSEFSAQDTAECKTLGRCDKYAAVVTNVGAVASSGSLVVKDTLPAQGVTLFNSRARDLTTTQAIPCAAVGSLVQCTDSEPVQPGASILVEVLVLTEPGGEATLRDEVEAQGGGAAAAVSASARNVADAAAPPNFSLADFQFSAYGMDGQPDIQAADHPQSVTAAFDFESSFIPGGGSRAYLPVEDPKDITVELPLGLVGNPQASAQRCLEADLVGKPVAVSPGFASSCPAASRIGTVVLNRQTGFESSQSSESVSPLYDMVPERGYPAVFGFRFISAPVLLYARVVPTPAGYRVRMTAPNLPHGASSYKILGAILSFFGAPDTANGLSTPDPAALFRNPTSCSDSAEELTAHIEVDSWVKPGRFVRAAAPAYPQIAGCDLLQFDPSLSLTAETTRRDSPSGYEIVLSAPPHVGFAELGAPDLKYAAVTLPPGVSLSPPGATGLAGCSEAEIDPLGTELGEGHPGGNGSPYDDGLEHPMSGHCPEASRIGRVEVKTPLLSDPLVGGVFIAQPSCGGAGQRECDEHSATDGELYGLYAEVAAAGVILKLRGKVSADPGSGQLTVTFAENPELPFEEIRLTLDRGTRAPLASPQACGTGAATSELEPRSAPASGPSAKPSAPLTTSGCEGPPGFAPRLLAGVTNAVAGAFTPFTFTLVRSDGEQDIGAVSTTLPPGLLGIAASVPRCGEAQANAGDCPAGSRIGTVRVASGAGPEPLWLEGPVYFTGPYAGAPFGLSIVVPAQAGPFDLGREVVRTALAIDPHTAQVTASTGAMRLIRDGIPFRLKEIDVDVDRPGFVFNPTNCARGAAVRAVVSGDLPDGSAGATAAVSSLFAVSGCRALPFEPSFSAEALAKHSKHEGASVHVTIRTPAGDANVASVHVEVPKILPSRLSTLNDACTEAQFALDPAGCPPGAFVGVATAYSPIVAAPLVGPAIFVSHGGAAFPNLDMVLQGEGVTIVLVGDTFIDKAGVTSSTFSSLPDVPVRQFDLDLPAGPHSALAASGDLCARPLAMPTTIVGQNGGEARQQTRIEVRGCKPTIGIVRHRVRGDVAAIVAKLPVAGTLLAYGRRLSRAVMHVRRAGMATVMVSLSRSERRFLVRHPGRRLEASVRLRLRRAHGPALHTRLTLLMGRG